jgi:hypothetical protein
MTNQTLKYFALSLTCLGMLLSAAPNMAQSKLARGRGCNFRRVPEKAIGAFI